MPSPPFEVWLDEERQIVRQRLYREPNRESFAQMIEQTDACASGLRDPLHVRVLVDGAWHGRIHRDLRALGIETLKDKPVTRVAVVNQSPLVRLVVRFINTATGMDKMRFFKNETDAIEWLLS